MAGSWRWRPIWVALPARRWSIAAGNGRGRSARWPAFSVPLQPVKHQYVITEKIDGLAPDAATLRDPDRRTYFKEEVGGLVFGGYEPNPIAWTHGRRAGRFRVPAVRRRLGSFRTAHGPGAGARAGAGEGRHQEDDQRARRASRRTATSSSARRRNCANFFVGAGLQRLRHRLGRRRGLGAGANGRRRARRRWTSGWSTSAASRTSTRTGNWTCDRTLEAYGKHYTIGFPHEEYAERPSAHRLAAL